MVYKIYFSSRAERDLITSFEWYGEINRKVLKKFDSELDNVLKYIQQNPYQFQIKYDNVRIAFLKKFPFGIHYIVNEDKIFVNSLFHTSQNSENWINK